MACTMLISRRLFQAAPNFKLETLVRHLGITPPKKFHRELADALVIRRKLIVTR
jgi:DNA polymerase-3 subunit epsilon